MSLGLADSAGNSRVGERAGIHSLDHFCLAVPDLEVARQFYEAFGLLTLENAVGLDLYTHDHPHRWARLIEGPRKQLRYVSFGAYATDIPTFATRLRQHAVEQLPPPSGEDGDGLWFGSPQRHVFQIKVAEKSSPLTPSSSSGIVERPMEGSIATSCVRPRRLSHVFLFTEDVIGTADLLTKVLGMRMSYNGADARAFLYAVHGSDHHIVGLFKSRGPGFHHCCWHVDTLEEVERGALHMKARSHGASCGPGRHAIGSNFYHYVRDPWGSYSEYSTGIDYIPPATDYLLVHGEGGVAGEQPHEGPPPDFTRNYEL